MRASPLHRSLAIGLLVVSAYFPRALVAEPLSIETPFPRLAERLAAGEITTEELVDTLIEGALTLRDLPPDFQPRPVADASFNQTLGQLVHRKTQEVLLVDSAAKAAGLQKLCEAFLPPDDPHRRAVAGLLSVASRIEHLEAVEKPVELVALRDETKDIEQLELVNLHVNQYLIKLAQKRLDRGEPDQALKLLAQVRTNSESPEFSAITLRSLTSYLTLRGRTATAWELDEEPIAVLVAAVRKNNPSVQDTLAELYAGRTLELVVLGNAEGAAAAFDRVIKERPDPDERNDALRLAIISAATSPSVKPFARGRLMDLELAGRLGLFTKFKLLVTGFYGKFYPIALFSCVGLVIFFALVSRLRPGFVLRLPRPRLAPPTISRRKKRQISGYKNPSFGIDEYSKLLLEFGLDDSATEEDIRKAYRNKMKELHPDGAAHPQDSDKFIDVKEAYERILEIQRTRFTKT